MCGRCPCATPKSFPDGLRISPEPFVNIFKRATDLLNTHEFDRIFGSFFHTQVLHARLGSSHAMTKRRPGCANPGGHFFQKTERLRSHESKYAGCFALGATAGNRCALKLGPKRRRMRQDAITRATRALVRSTSGTKRRRRRYWFDILSYSSLRFSMV